MSTAHEGGVPFKTSAGMIGTIIICDANYFSTRSGEPQHDGKSCLSRLVSACQSYRGHTGTEEQSTKDDGTAAGSSKREALGADVLHKMTGGKKIIKTVKQTPRGGLCFHSHKRHMFQKTRTALWWFRPGIWGGKCSGPGGVWDEGCLFDCGDKGAVPQITNASPERAIVGWRQLAKPC